MRINLEEIKNVKFKDLEIPMETLVKSFIDAGFLVVDKKEEPKFKEGHWYVHTEPGMEKFLIRIDDLDHSLCSGWDCKGKRFYKEYVWLGSRLKQRHDSVIVLNNLFSDRSDNKNEFKIYEGLRFLHYKSGVEFTISEIRDFEVIIKFTNGVLEYDMDSVITCFRTGIWIQIPDNTINPRLGRKQELVVLDDNNNAHEILRFTKKYKHLAPQVVEFIKSIQK